MNAVSENFGWIEIVLFAAIALGFGVWQLRSINREIAKDKAAAEERKRRGES
ncbi:MAG: hypothetical protein NTX28_00975 [Novosphingobium sp.]|nr:hypothetical protein [Novosphingobium sp.]